MIDVQRLLGRRGAARIALIPPPVLDALNQGLIETVNLNEFLAIDLARLAACVAAHIGLEPDNERLSDTLAMLGAFKPMKRHLHVARALYDLTAARSDRDDVAHRLATHASDVARCWAPQWVMLSDLALPDKLQAVRRFAADRHFGVRETAWMAVRDDPSRYVQNSVANWLNDASKSQALWVTQLSERWLDESDTPATRYIVRRALRTLSK